LVFELGADTEQEDRQDPQCSPSEQINKVTLRQAGLVLGWVTACRQVDHLGM